MRDHAIRYLKSAGYRFKPAESPDIWSHLEEHVAGRTGKIGAKFVPLSESMLAEAIARGEEALLDAMVARHKSTGRLDTVETTLDMPFIVGTDGTVPVKKADRACLARVIDQPGTARERLVNVLLAKADHRTGTRKLTVRGGLFPDGRTAGYYGLHPGGKVAAASDKEEVAMLVTPDELAALARDMENRAEDIAVVTRKECEAMLARVKKLLG